MSTIVEVIGREVLDTRGNPTVEVDVELLSGPWARHRPERGEHRGARGGELRDGGERYGGKGVLTAVGHVNGEIADLVVGMESTDQRLVDDELVTLDGTDGKSRLGANAILGVSLAVAKASADEAGLPLYRYVGGADAHVLPVPFLNVLNGGAHADSNVDIQEFMLAPVGAASFGRRPALGCGRPPRADVRVCTIAGSPPRSATKAASRRTCRRTRRRSRCCSARSRPPAIRRATSSRSRSTPRRPSSTRMAATCSAAKAPTYSSVEWADRLVTLCDRYPIVSIEDGMAEDDWDGWSTLTRTAR